MFGMRKDSPPPAGCVDASAPPGAAAGLQVGVVGSPPRGKEPTCRLG